MYITKKLIFIHIPKTGGMSMLGILGRMTGTLGYQAKRFHGSIQDNRPELMEGNKPIVAFVRNPYSWYVSWYHSLQRFPKNSSILFDLIYTNNFIDDINKLFDMFENEDLLQDEYQKRFLLRGRRPAAEYSNNRTFEQVQQWDQCGLLSWNYHWLLFGDEPIVEHNYTNITVGKQEASIQDRINFFNAIGLLTPTLKQRILNARRINTTQGIDEDYRCYYDDNLIERIAQKERYILNRYDYTFDNY